MNASRPDAQPTKIIDPRLRPDFFEQYLPFANGKPAPPPDAQEPNDRIILEFVAAYYDLNGAYSKLLQIRRRSDSVERVAAETECLREIEKLLIARDALEDLYAPKAVLTDAVIKDGFTVNIRFSFGSVDSRGRARSDLFRLTAEIPIPVPAGGKLEDFIVDFQGPEPYMPLTD